jgi:O-antigen/teichoic acid export membrane protein
LSLLGVDSANRAATFVLYALVGRYRGATEFGQMSLSLALLYSFQVLALAGLRTLVIREVARDRGRTQTYVVNGALVILAASVLSFAALSAFVRLSGYSADTSAVILLLALSLPVYALTTLCDAVFQAWERMHFSTFAQLPVQACKVAVGAFLLSRGYGLKALIVVLMVAQVAILAVEAWILCRYIVRPALRPSREFAAGLVRSGSTFLGIDVLIAVMGSSTVIFLSMFTSEGQVGLFSAANQLLVPLALVFQNVVLSVFPVMSRRGAVSTHALRRLSDGLLAALIALAVPTVIGLLFLARPGLLLVYHRPEFAGAAAPLEVMAWTLLLLPLTNVLGQVLVATRHESITLRIVAIDVVVNLALGAILISAFGLMGAALTALLTRSVDFLLHYRAAGRLVGSIQLHRLGWMPSAAGAALAGALLLTAREPLLLRILSGAAVYAATLLLLAGWVAGGVRQLKKRGQDLLGEDRPTTASSQIVFDSGVARPSTDTPTRS